ncbi:MAG: hypothetical protein ACE37I_20790 [Rubinisphaera brasiliensis]|uniref:Uncharacterized protein n=1 Tax=Rubinisphaera brasiliensis (strain ATCC 49424 / DSM 5305 / JCM 21570 / IAM 15109 / NBRC 103401 / IFAM 1448) TaxID=756272 RepID=F0SRN1_RUBBR|nr:MULTISPECIES: hypothetical protein [Rubinisphaera]ADY59154.1 hypothetical protein Plabr_1543 [Rubinisphaera brasiliensis DSM 5305]MBB02617.1 hypothetical protein [Planctomyces sp.]MBR9802525.1 hypothetical protein [bacterium]
MAIPPTWIENFVQQLSYCLFPTEVPAPLGCHYHYEAGCWEVAIFPSMRKSEPSESYEAAYRPSPFTFDIQQALKVFDDLHHVDWVAMPTNSENEAGPHLLLEGTVNDHSVLMRICAEVPARFQHEQDLIVQEN